MVLFSETEWDLIYNERQVHVNLTERMSLIAAGHANSAEKGCWIYWFKMYFFFL